jgi:hypothetical protein
MIPFHFYACPKYIDKKQGCTCAEMVYQTELFTIPSNPQWDWFWEDLVYLPEVKK